jgi:hypothetical protein
MSEVWDEWDVSVFDAASSPDDTAAWAATAEPWDAIQTPLGKLDPKLLSRRGCVDALTALERHKAWADAQQQRVLAVLASQPIAPTEPWRSAAGGRRRTRQAVGARRGGVRAAHRSTHRCGAAAQCVRSD